MDQGLVVTAYVTFSSQICRVINYGYSTYRNHISCGWNRSNYDFNKKKIIIKQGPKEDFMVTMILV